LGSVTEAAIGFPIRMKPLRGPAISRARVVEFLTTLPVTGIGKIDRG
jgi:hypothetical protein